jgi:D-proline reductase (dithiol) PrdB
MKEPERYIKYISRTRNLYSSHSAYRWAENADAPWTPLAKPLNRCRVALASSAGIYLKGQTPFHTKDDTSIREIPKDALASDFSVNHFGYRMDGAERDPNCVFPLEQLRKLEAEGFIGELAETAYTFMGGIYSARRVREELSPQLVERALSAEIDLFYLVPA